MCMRTHRDAHKHAREMHTSMHVHADTVPVDQQAELESRLGLMWGLVTSGGYFGFMHEVGTHIAADLALDIIYMI